jgi:regulator of sigma E protease
VRRFTPSGGHSATTVGATLDLPCRPQLPPYITQLDEDRPVPIESLGIALAVTNEIAAVESAGAAAKQGMQPGDRIVGAQFVLGPADAQRDDLAGLGKSFEIADAPGSWNAMQHVMQQMQTGTAIRLEIERGVERLTCELPILYSDQYTLESRGLYLTPRKDFYQSPTLWNAIQLGFRQTGEDATRVIKFLRRLISGQIPVTTLGGPQTIAVAATMEASEGTSRLLLFLTLLSANLAVVNFLPIPVLDGGHMMFLAYEGIFRRPVNERIQIVLSFAGLIFIVGLMLFVIGLDVWRGF